MKEIWKSIKGYEGYYEISDLGRVRSISRKVNNRYGGRIVPGKIMKYHPNKNGYLQVSLTKKGKGELLLVHRIVLETFEGQCPYGMEGCHDDNDKTNNKLSNLRWDTHVNNMKDSVKPKKRVTTTSHGNSGTNHSRCKLTEANVLEIRKRSISETYKYLSIEFGVSLSTISGIVNRYTWTHI